MDVFMQKITMIVFLNELPYNETGKLLRRVLKEKLVALGDGSTI